MSVTYGGDSITFADSSVISSGTTHFKNMVINGDMRIAQRGNTFTNLGQSTDNWPADRFKFHNADTAVYSASQVSDAPDGFIKSIKIQTTTANTSHLSESFIDYLIEGYDCARLLYGTSSAASATASFWVKASIAGKYNLWCYNSTGTKNFGKSFTVNSSNTWEYKTVTIPGDTLASIDSTSGVFYLRFYIDCSNDVVGTLSSSWSSGGGNRMETGSVRMAATVNSTYQITGVQLELGSTATKFEYRPYGTELALCQRYYEKSYDTNTAPGTSVNDNQGVWMFRGSGVNSRDYVTFQYKQTKRSSPTVTIYSVTGASGYYRAAVAATNYAAQVNGSGVNSTTMQSNSTAPTNDQCGFLWVADAEL